MNFYNSTRYIDELTGVYNKNFIDNYYNDNIYSNFIITFLDFDNFKYINDTFDHSFGDRLLKYLAQSIRELLKNNGVLIRFGGDEFLVLFENKDKKEVENCIQEIINNFNNVFEFEGKEILLTLSAGIYKASREEKLSELIRKSDLALYESKNTGKAKLTFFSEDLEEKLKRKTELIIRLRKAIDSIDNNEFYVVYQPILDLETLKIKEVEALARLRCKDIGEVSPVEFVPLLEETGLIRQFGNIVLEKVFKQLREWDEKGIEVSINVNISPIQLRDKKLVSKLKVLKEKYKVDLNRIVFEITETQMLELDNLQQEIFNEIKDMGITLAIDDYGNDYSQMTNIIKVPAKEIKIAKEIVQLIVKDDKVKLMIKYFVGLLRRLGYIIVAEGVETEEQFNELKDMGCSKIQGYYVSKPTDEKKVEDFLTGYSLKDVL